jgi:hypothetical protein
MPQVMNERDIADLRPVVVFAIALGASPSRLLGPAPHLQEHIDVGCTDWAARSWFMWSGD